ncbi:MAG TPA: inositol monophosphatase [Clostridiaceae bacterium]|nr:inositol monophosphatase [Clostridiaceae bacterium]
MYQLTNKEKFEAIRIVLQSSNIITSKIKSPEDKNIVKQKGFADYVTKIDYDVQKYIENQVLNLFPDHQFLGEENEQHEFDQSIPCWILDPVDGTKNLILNAQHSSISLAFWNGEELAFALIYNPFLDELYEASKNEGSYLIRHAKQQIIGAKEFQALEKMKLIINDLSDLRNAIVAFGSSPYDRGTEIDHKVIFQVLYDIFDNTEDIRRYGSAALDLAYLAANRHHIFFESKLRPWDFAAGILIVQESGGVVTDFYNKPIDIFKVSSVLSANPILHKLVLPFIEKLLN